MANKPEFSVDQIETLYKNGKISPSTKELLVSRVPAEKEKPSLLEGGFFNPMDKDAEEKRGMAGKLLEGGFLNQDPVPPKGFEPKVPEVVVAEKKIATPEVEKIDPSMFANVAAPQPQKQAPVDIMKSSGLGSAFNQQMEGVKALGEAQSQAAQNQEKLINDAATQAKEYDDKVKLLSDERAKASEDHLKNLNAMQKEVEAKATINPNRFWETRSTGQKVSAILGIMLGGLGGGFSGRPGENKGLEMLNRAIDADIDAQKANYANARGSLEDKKSAYALAMGELGNQQAATIAAKSSALGVIELKLKALSANATSGEAKAKADIALGQIAEEKAKLNAGLTQQVQAATASRQAASQGVEDPNLLPEEMRKRVVKMPDGLYRPAVTEQAAKTVGEVLSSGKSMQNILIQMRELNNPSLPYSTKQALAEALKTEYIFQKKNVEQLGVLSQTDRDMVESTLGNPGGWRPERTEALISLAEKNLNGKIQNTLSQYVPGYRPITKGQAVPVRK